MNVNDILPPAIPTVDTDKLMADLIAKMEKYPKDSLSKREVVESIGLGEMSYEEAMKIADKLNAEVTKTILSFADKIKSK